MSSGSTLVVGGSRGIGRAIVEALARAGQPVAFTFRSDQEGAQALEAACGGAARAYRFDMVDPDAAEDLVIRVEEQQGPVEGLVNNAGVRTQGLLAMSSSDDWSRLFEANLIGPFRCCRAVLPGMVHRRGGSIVNVASLSAVRGVAGLTAYSASKAGLIGMTRSLAREVGKRGVRVNAIVPGFVATDMTADLPPATVAKLREGECLPQGVDMSCIAQTVLFLLSAKACSITGQHWIIDAGVSV